MDYTFQQLLLGLFAVANNIAALSPFLAISDGLEKKDQLKLAKIATLASVLTMLASMVVAIPILSGLGISISAFRIAGGIILCLTGLSMLNSSPTQNRSSKELTLAQRIPMVIVPVSIPLTAGPGSISTIAIFTQDMTEHGQNLWWLILAILCMSVFIYLLFKYSTKLSALLGNTGMNVLIKIAGLFTLALGVQFILSGIGQVILQIAAKLHKAMLY